MTVSISESERRAMKESQAAVAKQMMEPEDRVNDVIKHIESELETMLNQREALENGIRNMTEDRNKLTCAIEELTSARSGVLHSRQCDTGEEKSVTMKVTSDVY